VPKKAASLEDRILAATWDLLLAKGARELSVERIAVRLLSARRRSTHAFMAAVIS
jgi:AcrR family transcriptional regulator